MAQSEWSRNTNCYTAFSTRGTLFELSKLAANIILKIFRSWLFTNKLPSTYNLSIDNYLPVNTYPSYLDEQGYSLPYFLQNLRLSTNRHPSTMYLSYLQNMLPYQLNFFVNFYYILRSKFFKPTQPKIIKPIILAIPMGEVRAHHILVINGDKYYASEDFAIWSPFW